MELLSQLVSMRRAQLSEKVGRILPAVPLSKREAEDDFKTDRAAFKKASAVRTDETEKISTAGRTFT